MGIFGSRRHSFGMCPLLLRGLLVFIKRKSGFERLEILLHGRKQTNSYLNILNFVFCLKTVCLVIYTDCLHSSLSTPDYSRQGEGSLHPICPSFCKFSNFGPPKCEKLVKKTDTVGGAAILGEETVSFLSIHFLGPIGYSFWVGHFEQEL